MSKVKKTKTINSDNTCGECIYLIAAVANPYSRHECGKTHKLGNYCGGACDLFNPIYERK